MTIRAVDGTTQIRESRKVSTIAVALELDESQIRRLVDQGELEAHGVGKRGLRIYLDSVAAYQDRQARKASKRMPATNAAARARAQATSAAHRSAIEELRRDGLIP